MSTSQGEDTDLFNGPASLNSYATSSPTPSPPLSPLFQPQSNSSHGANGMDILAAVFFAVAGTWLVVAMCYSGMVLLFLRMRARGQLENLYDEEFGRIYLCGSRRYYIPLGCLFRRYLIQMQNQSGTRRRRHVRYMSTRERRQAMEVLLINNNNQEDADDKENDERPALEVDIETGNDVNVDTASVEGPLCSICLGDYEPQDRVLVSKTCAHEFHQDCILDWLQRPGNVECPCCRSLMVSEEDVWKTVHRIRKERKRQQRAAQRNGISRKTSLETQELEATESSDVTDLDADIAPSTLEERPVYPPDLDDDHQSVDSAGTVEAHGSRLEL